MMKKMKTKMMEVVQVVVQAILLTVAVVQDYIYRFRFNLGIYSIFNSIGFRSIFNKSSKVFRLSFISLSNIDFCFIFD